ncbi:magnesium and cobalt transport protein CorA [Nocardiopsis trehalosi]|jgi:magnesium transporter|uniref:magnesium and cobalt transport protein CorA n=1 Tax=Nocardiopsis trehalosi TaxID=109329 RepID=UPI000830151F|nr:magnesium and cobalt transport protein CorA [Nocardiopsis trehalosi]
MPQRRTLAWLPGLRAAQQVRRTTDRRRPATDGAPAPELSLDPRRETHPSRPVEDSVIDAAVYVDGHRRTAPDDLGELHRSTPDDPGALAWIGLLKPSSTQLLAAADEFGLHELAVEDAIVAHQRPKLERYDDTLFVVLKAARYVDADETVEFGEIHVFTGPNFVLTVRHGDAPDLSTVRRRLEGDPRLLALGPEAVLYAILDAVVDGYAPVVAGLQNDIDEIETQVFDGDPKVSRRIYELSREVIEFQRATHPLLGVLRSLTGDVERADSHDELRRHLRDVHDHATTVAERVDGFRQMLQDILAVNATLVTQAQNEEMRHLTEASYQQGEVTKKISAWAAILFAPTLVAGVYGMNFTHMPETHWAFGYPFAISLMVIGCLVLYAAFKRRNWM